MPTYAEYRDLCNRADSARISGDLEAARDLSGQAADVLWRLVQATPDNHPRTRAMYGLDAARLYLCAGRYDEAETVGRWVEGLVECPPHVARRIDDLWERLRTAREEKAHADRH